MTKEQLERAAEGSGVPFHTLLKIQNGATNDPRISTIQKLYEYLQARAA